MQKTLIIKCRQAEEDTRSNVEGREVNHYKNTSVLPEISLHTLRIQDAEIWMEYPVK